MDNTFRAIRTACAQFHLLVGMFDIEVILAERPPIPETEIRALRAQGLSLRRVAQQTNTSIAVVRRIVGKFDLEAQRQQRERQEGIAARIDAEPIT